MLCSHLQVPPFKLTRMVKTYTFRKEGRKDYTIPIKEEREGEGEERGGEGGGGGGGRRRCLRSHVVYGSSDGVIIPRQYPY